MSPAGKRAAAAILVAMVGAALWWSLARPSVSHPSASPPPAAQRRSAPDRPGERETAETAARRRMTDDWGRLLDWLRTDPRPSPEEIRLRLTQLRKDWAEIDPIIRAEIIARLLGSGEDLPTGLPFRVGVHGLLAEWPTLRVFLLDVLATSDPEAAVIIARKILDSTTSADEFAIALRSLTRPTSGASASELHARFETLLTTPEWQTSRGFAESLDLARFLGTPDAARQLARWNGNPTLRTLALDEFTSAHPQAMFEAMADASSLTPLNRATLMARARPDQPDQLARVDSYLTHPDLSAEEAAAFLRSYPLRGATTGHRLYGKLPAPYDFEQIRAGDRAALQQVDRWLTDPTLERFRPQIQSLHQRLTEWVRQAE